MFWRLAKIQELLPSNDGAIRAVKIRAVHGETGKGLETDLRRPIQHLIPLELQRLQNYVAQL